MFAASWFPGSTLRGGASDGLFSFRACLFAVRFFLSRFLRFVPRSRVTSRRRAPLPPFDLSWIVLHEIHQKKLEHSLEDKLRSAPT